MMGDRQSKPLPPLVPPAPPLLASDL
jgi:hypothetical protein